MYPAEIVRPMKEELTTIGFQELISTKDVENALSASGTSLVVVNSVCGCAAANARPAVRISLNNENTPDHLYTVFAGVDREATDAARAKMIPFPPSSPSLALFKDGELVKKYHPDKLRGQDPAMIKGAEEKFREVQKAYETLMAQKNN